MTTANNKMEVSLMNAIDNNLVNKSQVKGESYSLFCVTDISGNKRYEVMHNTSKKLTSEHEQIFVCAKNEDKLFVSFRSKNIETEKELHSFTKEDLEKIAEEANQLKDGQSIYFDNENDSFYTEFTDETEQFTDETEQFTDIKQLIANHPKQLLEYYGIELTAKETEIMEIIFNVVESSHKENITQPIYSKWVTEGSLSISGTISMLNRKGLITCDKGRINGGRKLPIITLTPMSIDIYQERKVNPIELIKTYEESRPEYQQKANTDWNTLIENTHQEYSNLIEEMKMCVESSNIVNDII